jgi:hypothetical protein
MMFQRVTRSTFYDRVDALRIAADTNGHTFNRRESEGKSGLHRVTYECNGIANAQAVMNALPLDAQPKYYVLQ